MDVMYTAEATSSGGREGRVRTSDGVIDLPLSMPKELGGLGKPGTTNPEELFAAGYAACFENAMLRAARERKVRPTGTSVTARVGIGRMENGRFSLKVDLAVTLSGIERSRGRGAGHRRARGDLPLLAGDARQHRGLRHGRLGRGHRRESTMSSPSPPFRLQVPGCRDRGAARAARAHALSRPGTGGALGLRDRCRLSARAGRLLA